MNRKQNDFPGFGHRDVHEVHMSHEGMHVSGHAFTPVLRLYWPARDKHLKIEGLSVVSVGRGENCWLSFSDAPWQKYLSRDHAYFSLDGYDWTYVDLHPTNPAFINNVQVQSGTNTTLKPGDRIRLTAMSDELILESAGE